jgi:hypothetical protein
MEKRHRLLRLVIESLVVMVMLATSIVGTGSISVASAHPVPQRSPSASSPFVSPSEASSASSMPGQTAPSLPVGPWYAPHSEMSGPLYGPYAAGTPTASQGRKPGEQADLRTETSDTILNPDGTWTLKSYSVPINYKDAQGHWQPIDNTLISDTSDSGYAFGNRADGWHIHFAAQSGGANLVHAQFPTVTVAETLNGAATVHATTNGSQISYPGVFLGSICSMGLARSAWRRPCCSRPPRYRTAMRSPIISLGRM